MITEPLPFEDAVRSLKRKGLLPTSLTSKQLKTVDARLRERAVFSARVYRVEQLQKISDILARKVNGELDNASARLELKEFNETLDYTAPEGEAGTIADLATDGRLNLILETNTALIQGAGRWQEGNTESILEAFPCQELRRVEPREHPRVSESGEPDEYWPERWEQEGGDFYDGRMIARKDDAICSRVSYFGLPYGPPHFNSGYDWVDIDRDESIALGVINEDTEVKPDDRDLNDDLEMTPDVRDEKLREALEEAGHEFDGDVLTARDAAVRAGDLPGHEFRGNQWTGGAGNRQTDSPAFKAWFGDSKVVDKDGNPLVVYHGTNSPDDFTVFERTGSHDSGWYGKGFYFTSNAGHASEYARGYAGAKMTDHARVFPVFVSLQNPIVAGDRNGVTSQIQKMGGNPNLEGGSLTRELQRLGFDGAIIKNGNEIVAFKPDQIKSAYGNKGTFDPKNADISASGDFDESKVTRDDKGRFASHLGVVDSHGAARSIELPITDLFETTHGEKFPDHTGTGGRWRAVGHKATWFTDPTDEERHAVEEHMAKKGFSITSHAVGGGASMTEKPFKVDQRGVPDWRKTGEARASSRLPALLIEPVKAGGYFDDSKHPRDEKGRFTDSGVAWESKGGKHSTEGWSQTGGSEKAIKISHAEHGEHWLPARGVKLENGRIVVTDRGRDILDSKILQRRDEFQERLADAQADTAKIEAGESLNIQRHENGDITLSGGKVERETEKAVLLSHPEFENMWLPKSQVTMEGDKARIPAWLADQKLVTMHTEVETRITGETEKAYKVDVDVQRPDGEPYGATVFLPKSLVKNVGYVGLEDNWNTHHITIPRWLKAAKEAEFEAMHSGGGFTFRLMW